MRIEFQLPHKIINLYVELLDNPGVRAWADCFANGYQTTVTYHDHLYVRSNDFGYIAKAYRAIPNLLEQLARLDIVYRGLPMVEFDLDNSDSIHQWLNHLHRFFTHNQQKCNLKHFGNNFDYRLGSELLDKLNTHIHELELYLPRGPADIPVSEINELKLYHPTESGNGGWTNLLEFSQYHSADYYDVILTSEILGKTILQSYLDLDDPSDWDTSGHYASAGGLQICIEPTRQQIYQSQSFQNWLGKHQVDPNNVKYDYPIGNIVNKHSPEWNELIEIFKKTASPNINVTYRKQ